MLIGFVGTDRSPQGSTGCSAAWTACSTAATSTLLGHQVLGVLFTIVWTGVLTTLIGLAIKYTIGWRIERGRGVDGIDFAEHGESAYDFDGRSGGVLGGHTEPSSQRTPGAEATEGAMA